MAPEEFVFMWRHEPPDVLISSSCEQLSIDWVRIVAPGYLFDTAVGRTPRVQLAFTLVCVGVGVRVGVAVAGTGTGVAVAATGTGVAVD